MRSFIRPASQSLSVLLGVLLPGLAAHAADGALYLRGGSVRLTDDTQTIDSLPRNLDSWSHGTFSASIETRRRRGLAFGFEYLSYRNYFTPPATGKGEARVRIAQFIIKNYFGERDVRPFVGLGFGGGNTEWEYTSGGLKYNDAAFTLALQLNAGVEFRIDNVGFLLEAKHLVHDTEGNWGDYNPTGTGLFAGVGFMW